MRDTPFLFLPEDRFIRRVNRFNQSPPGKPRPSGFRNNRDRRTSVYLERVLQDKVIPFIMPGDLLAIFLVQWIENINNIRYPAKSLSIEHTHDAHFEIVGEMDHRFAKFLCDNSEIFSHEQWLTAQKNRSDT